MPSRAPYTPWLWVELIGFDNEQPDFGVQHYLDNAGLKASFVVLIGLFALSWILKFGEWLVLEKKLV